MILPVAWNRAATGRGKGGAGGVGWVMWERAQRPVIYCIAFNIRKAGLFAEAPRRSVGAIGSRRGFFFKPRAALPAGCRCAAAAGSVACAVEIGRLPGGARRWKRVKAPKGNSCAAAILLPTRFLARCSRRLRRASSGRPPLIPSAPPRPSLRLSPRQLAGRHPGVMGVEREGEERAALSRVALPSPLFPRRHGEVESSSSSFSPSPRASGFSRFHASSVLTKLCCCWRQWLPKVC